MKHVILSLAVTIAALAQQVAPPASVGKGSTAKTKPNVSKVESAAQAKPENSHKWFVFDRKDPFTGEVHTFYSLQGDYLSAPSDERKSAPLLLLGCKDGEVGSASLSGGFQFDSNRVGRGGVAQADLDYRLDGGAPQPGWSYLSKDSRTATLGDRLVRPWLSVKEVLIQAGEFPTGTVVIHFSIPVSSDTDRLRTSCGGMTRQEALAQKVKLVDGSEISFPELKERLAMGHVKGDSLHTLIDAKMYAEISDEEYHRWMNILSSLGDDPR
jgi:hypothetical protein